LAVFLVNAVALPLLAQSQCGVALQSMDVVTFNPLVDPCDFLHGFISLQFELLVVEVDELIAEPVHIPTEASLPRHDILVVVDIFVEEVPVLELALREVEGELIIGEGLANGVRLIGLVWLVHLPELAPDLVADARLCYQLVVEIEIDLDSVEALA